MRLAIDFLNCRRLAEVCRAGSAKANQWPLMDHFKIHPGGAEAVNRHVFLQVPVKVTDAKSKSQAKRLMHMPGEWWVHGSALKLVRARQELVLDTATRRLEVVDTRTGEETEVPDKALTEMEDWPIGAALLADARKGSDAVTFGLSGKVLRHLHKLLPTRAEEWGRVVLHVRPDADGNAEGLIEVEGPDGCQAVIAPLILR